MLKYFIKGPVTIKDAEKEIIHVPRLNTCSSLCKIKIAWEVFIAIPFACTNAIVISAGYHDSISLNYPAWQHPESERELFDLYR